MIDTHAHLNIEDFTNDLDTVIKNAKNSNVNTIFVIGMDYDTSKRAIEIAKNYDNVYATVGLHPSYIDNSLDELDSLYNNKKVIAVGEIGLDYYWQSDNKLEQEEIFEKQLIKAISLDLPVIIHTRNSFKEAYDIVSKYKGKIKGVFHCFSSNYQDALKVLELGMYIGIDGPITFKKNLELKEIVENIPLESILIETDSPYMSPEPNRGKRNEPKNLYYIAKKIAEIKGLKIEDIIKITTINATNLFLGGIKND